MANGNGAIDPVSALPPWLRGVLTVILQHGVAAAVALWLVWFISQQMTADLREMSSQLREHDVRSQAAGRMMTEFASDQDAQARALISLMRQVCVNTARTDEQRRECVR